jgi:hypothetical protein
VVNSWDRKVLTFISQTNDWDRNGQISSFLSFSIALLGGLAGAYLSLELDFEDEVTARVKEASPEYLNDLIFNPGPLQALIDATGHRPVFWAHIPEKHALGDLLQALSSAVILPVKAGKVNAAIILGWSEPQNFDTSFKDGMEIVRQRLKEILVQSHLQRTYNSAMDRYTGILDTLPQALVFIGNDGQSGWVNARAASLLQLQQGEQAPSVLSVAMGKLINSALNKEEINKEAVRLFSSPGSSLQNMKWELEAAALMVSCVPVDGKGRLWSFV